MDALKPEGILAIWSASPDMEFANLLSQAGFVVTVVPVEAKADDMPDADELEYVILFAQRA
jgi:hypothetical protein